MKEFIFDKILKSSIELLFAKGLKDISISDIVKKADVSTRTFYRYFESKEALIEFLIVQGLKGNMSSLKMVKQQVKDPIDAYVIFTNTTYPGVKMMSAQFFIDLVKYYPKQYNLINSFLFKDVVDFNNEIIKKGQKMGYFRKSINGRLCSIYIAVSPMKAMFDIFLDRKEYTKEQVFLESHRIVMYGICTEKGSKRFKEATKNYFPELLG
jgi:AcrR family transcriptional regulator